ncbi:hypothetical protein POM88_054366 [Heracleum sosnowskyi]|uniref:ACT domain-containing protein ACR n=1 Tax=Heracleum sosnowskyi TaxID=360622 RepID=A0AAD8LWY1_9APIA|nr:hypothetical protein POM88_054366 [Heracleum sosnowskyi]
MNSEEEEAALILCSMKNSKVDSTTSLQLEETRVSILKKHKLQHPSSLSPLSNNTRLLSLVPPSLAEVIGDCSTPFDKRLTGSDIQENQAYSDWKNLLWKIQNLANLVACERDGGRAIELAESFSKGMDDEYEKLFRRINPPRVVIDNESCNHATVIQVDTYISSDGGWFMDVFNVTDQDGNEITEVDVLDYIYKALRPDSSNFGYSIRRSVGVKSAMVHIVIELIRFDKPGLLSELCALLNLKCNVVSTDHAQLRAMPVQILGEERCIEVGDYGLTPHWLCGLVLPECDRFSCMRKRRESH